MLRLPPSKIELGPRDIDWHTTRWERRRAEFEARSAASNVHPFLPFQHPDSALLSWIKPDDSVLAPGSVPFASKEFWDAVVANAGRPVNVQSEGRLLRSENDAAPLSEAPLSLPPADDQESIGELTETSLRRFARDLPDRYNLHSGRSSDGDGDGDDDNRDGSGESVIRHTLPTSRPSYFLCSRPRIVSQTSDLALGDHGSSSSAQFNLDGPRDELSRAIPVSISRARSRMRLISSPRSTRSRLVSPNWRLEPSYGSQTASESPNTRSERGQIESISRSLETSERRPGSFERPRERSHTLPRSRLRISQVAASSSPDRRTVDTTSGSQLPAPGFLSHPPRRRQTPYSGEGRSRARMYGYSLLEEESTTESEDDVSSGAEAIAEGSNIIRPPVISRANRLRTPSPTLPALPITPSSNHASLPSQRSSEGPRSSVFSYLLSSRSPRRSRVPPRSPSPDDIHASPPNDHLVPSRPVSPPPSHLLRSLQSRPTLSLSPPAPTPRTPRRQIMQVYNDALPPNTQPQTPVGLPRDGVPAPSLRGYYTAPPLDATNRRTRRTTNVTNTPTRAGTRQGRLNENQELFDQENEAAITMEVERIRREREQRRARANGQALGTLETTPPREGRDRWQ